MKKSSTIFKKFIQLIIAALIGKGLGFIREMVLAYYFGASAVSDVYVAVQNIPAIIFTLFGVAITTGFIPIYTKEKVEKGKEKADSFTNNIFNIFLVLSVVLTILGIIFSKQLVMLFAGGFTGNTFDMCNSFTKIIMPTSVAIILVYVYNAYLQLYDSFNQNSLMNVPYNIAQILFIIIGFYSNNYYFLAIGLLIASFSQLIYLRILVRTKTTFKHNTTFSFNDPLIKEMLILVAPVFISTGVNQLNSIIDRALASRLTEGSIAALNYSNEVTSIATQVVILSLTTILYPKLTELFAKEDDSRFVFTERYINVVGVLVLPIMGLMFVFSREIIDILFGRGAFTSDTVDYVSRALKIYALGIAGASFRDAFNKLFYSIKNTVIPMVNGIIAVLSNIALNFLLIKKYEYLGLAFATSFAATFCTILLFIQLCRKMKELNVKSLMLELAKNIVATGGMIGVCYLVLSFISISNSFLRCLVFMPIALAVYGVILLITREKIAVEAISKIRNKIKL